MEIKTSDTVSFQSIGNSENVHFSGSEGLNISFQNGNNTITFWTSLFTGGEKVLINNQAVSKKRSFRRHTKHSFRINENDYVIEFKVTSIHMYTWTCTLYKNGSILNEIECKNNPHKQRFLKKHPGVLGGGLIGFAYAMDVIPLYAVLVLFIIGTILSIWYWKKSLIVIQSVPKVKSKNA